MSMSVTEIVLCRM